MSEPIDKIQFEGHEYILKSKFESLLDSERALRIKAEKALRIAAGYISTFEPHKEQHPQEVYDLIFSWRALDDFESGE